MQLDPTILESDGDDLKALQKRMDAGLRFRAGEDDSAARVEFEAILAAEPRLAEPRLELGHILLLEERFDEAEEHVRLAVSTLRAGGQWTEDVEPKVLLSFAINLLGETLARSLEEGDLFLTDRAGFTTRWNQAAAHFREAATIDPTNVDAIRNRLRFAPLDESPAS